MDIITMSTVVKDVGFPIGIALILIILIVRYINKKDRENREDTKEQISALRRENKEDKTIFQNTVSSFNQAIAEFKTVNNTMCSIETKINNMEQDITIIKTKMEK